MSFLCDLLLMFLYLFLFSFFYRLLTLSLSLRTMGLFRGFKTFLFSFESEECTQGSFPNRYIVETVAGSVYWVTNGSPGSLLCWPLVLCLLFPLLGAIPPLLLSLGNF